MTGRLIVTAIPLHHYTGHNKTRCNSQQRIAKHCNTTRPQSPRHYTATHHSSVHLNTAHRYATQCTTTYCTSGYHNSQPIETRVAAAFFILHHNTNTHTLRATQGNTYRITWSVNTAHNTPQCNNTTQPNTHRGNDAPFSFALHSELPHSLTPLHLPHSLPISNTHMHTHTQLRLLYMHTHKYACKLKIYPGNKTHMHAQPQHRYTFTHNARTADSERHRMKTYEYTLFMLAVSLWSIHFKPGGQYFC